MQMRATSAADRHPLPSPCYSPLHPHYIRITLPSLEFEVIRVDGLSCSPPDFRGNRTPLTKRSAIGNGLRMPVLAGDMDGET
jgi:hypothetical protein